MSLDIAANILNITHINNMTMEMDKLERIIRYDVWKRQKNS
jgi:hypothetical protein